TIVSARDRDAAALFLTEILGLPSPAVLGPFAVVPVGDNLSLDYMQADGEIASQHYAFLVSEVEFDEIFARICARNLPYWADPHKGRCAKTTRGDDGRGVYFEAPSGPLLEFLPRAYGRGGPSASLPPPLAPHPPRRAEQPSRPAAGRNARPHPATAECPK